MAKPLITDLLWDKISPLLPAEKPRRYRFPGRKRLEDRKVLTGILFVLKSGIPWEELPQEMGCGCGMTCWRRLDEWQRAGIWPQVLDLLKQELPTPELYDWVRAEVERGGRRVHRARQEPPQPHTQPSLAETQPPRNTGTEALPVMPHELHSTAWRESMYSEQNAHR